MFNKISDEEAKNLLFLKDDVELSDFDEFPAHSFSEEHQKNMEKLYKSNMNTNHLKGTTRKNFGKVRLALSFSVSIVVLLFILMPDTMIAFGKSIISLIVEDRGKYSVVTYDNAKNINGETQPIKLVYDSTEFKLVSSKRSSGKLVNKYVNDKGKYIEIVVLYNNGSEIALDTENVKINKIIKGEQVYYYISKLGVLQVLFEKGDVSYLIESDLEIEVLMKEIDRIK